MAVVWRFHITGAACAFEAVSQSCEVQLSTRGLYPDDNTLLGSKYFLYRV